MKKDNIMHKFRKTIQKHHEAYTKSQLEKNGYDLSNPTSIEEQKKIIFYKNLAQNNQEDVQKNEHWLLTLFKNKHIKKTFAVASVFFYIISSSNISMHAQENLKENVATEIIETLEEEVKKDAVEEITEENAESTSNILDEEIQEEMSGNDPPVEQKAADSDETADTFIMSDERMQENEMLIVAHTSSGNAIRSSVDAETLLAYMKDPNGFQKQLRANGNSSGMLTWEGTYSTPMIWLDGTGWVYCIEPYVAFPNGDWYDEGEIVSDMGWRSILGWGFPRNHGGQHGLTDQEAYLRTFVALNAYLGNYNRTTVESFEDSYVNMLLQKGDAKDYPIETYTIHAPSNKKASYNPQTKRLETALYGTSGAVSDFWLEDEPQGFFMVDEAGNKVDRLPIGSSFRLATNNLSYDGTVTFNIKTDIQPTAAVKFRAVGVQTLLGMKRRDPLPAKQTTATFEPAVGGFKGKKKDSVGSLLNGKTFTLFEDASATIPVKDIDGKIVTLVTKNGELSYPQKIIVGDYYLHEKKPDGTTGSLPGYLPLDHPLKVTIKPGEIIDIGTITNVVALKKQYEGIKYEGSMFKPLELITLDIYEDVNHTIVDTVTTDFRGFYRTKMLDGNYLKDGVEHIVNHYAIERDTGLHVDLGKIALDGENVGGIITTNINNIPKKPVFPIYKVAESNPVGITADGSVWGLFNENNEELERTTITAGKGAITDLDYNHLSLDISTNYWQEISTRNESLVLDPNKYYLPAIAWEDILDGQEITLDGNSSENPLVNKIKRLAVEEQKFNEYGEPLHGVELGLFSEDTEDEEGNVVQNQIERLVSDANGHFYTAMYPIYMFNRTDLAYIQEQATVEHHVVITQKYDMPVIDPQDYGLYEDGQYLKLLPEGETLINYWLRLNLGGYKANEDMQFLPHTEYKLYDENKKHFATTTTDETGKLLFENLRFDFFVNKKDPTSPTVPFYIRETKTMDNNVYELDYTKYYLPNLVGQEENYHMGDTVWLSTIDEPFINKYLTRDVKLVKNDDSGENRLEGAKYKVTRLSGKAEQEVPGTIGELENTIPLKDVQSTEEVTTGANGEVILKEQLYGKYVVEEICAPSGYIGDDCDMSKVPDSVKKYEFTIDENSPDVIEIHFFNTKKVMLVTTGSNMFGIGLIGGINLLFISALLFYMRYKNNKKVLKMAQNVAKITTVFAIIGISVFGMNMHVSAHEILQPVASNLRSAPPIDPNDGSGEYDTLPDEKPSKASAERSAAEKPIAAQPSHAEPADVSDFGNHVDANSVASTYESWHLASAGEYIFEAIAASTSVMLISLIIIIYYKHRRDANEG